MAVAQCTDDEVVADPGKGFERFGAFPFHDDADDDGEQDRDEDADAFQIVRNAAGDALEDVHAQCDQPCHDEHDNHGFPDGVPDAFGHRFGFVPGQPVGAVTLTVRFDLSGCQSA